MVKHIIHLKFYPRIAIIGFKFFQKVPPRIDPENVWEKEFHKQYIKNTSGIYEVSYIHRARKLDVGRTIIEYEGEDSGIGLLFASKAIIQIIINPLSGAVIDMIGKWSWVQ